MVDLEAAPFALSVRDPEENPTKGSVYELDAEAARSYYDAPLRDLRGVMTQCPDDVVQGDGIRALSIRDGIAFGASTDLLGEPVSEASRSERGIATESRDVESQGYRGRLGVDGFALLVRLDTDEA